MRVVNAIPRLFGLLLAAVLYELRHCGVVGQFEF